MAPYAKITYQEINERTTMIQLSNWTERCTWNRVDEG